MKVVEEGDWLVMEFAKQNARAAGKKQFTPRAQSANSNQQNTRGNCFTAGARKITRRTDSDEYKWAHKNPLHITSS